MFFRRRRRRSNSGFIGLLVVLAILYFTGAGKWLWDRVLRLDETCFAMLAQMGTDNGNSLCGGIGTVAHGVDDGATAMADKMRQWFGDKVSSDTQDKIASIQNFSKGLWERVSDGTLADWASPADKLEDLMHRGPAGMGTAFTPRERLQHAVDQFTIGEHYLSTSSTDKALEWLQAGASQKGGYGVLSQLSLGDMYSHGSGGVAANPMQAVQYYSQANQSIGMLQQSNSPEAQQMLQGLPASPGVIQQQLIGAIQQLQGGVIHH